MDTTGLVEADLVVDPKGIVAAISKEINVNELPVDISSIVQVEAGGSVIMPPFVDMHCHLRAIVQISEDYESGCRAAAKGGFGYLMSMPNTDPATDSVDSVLKARTLISNSETMGVKVEIASAITKGRNGVKPVDFESLIRNQVRYFTDDGSGINDREVMQTAIRTLEGTDCILAQHLEEKSAFDSGIMNLGDVSTKLGLAGISKNAEVLMLARDIELLSLNSVKYHAMHLSVAESVELVKKAKDSGLKLTCEVTPHHLFFDETELLSLDPNFKVNPPLRPYADVVALRQGLLDKTIDVIATDHAPHRAATKEMPIETAPFGMLGLQTAFSAAFTSLLDNKDLNSLNDCANELTVVMRAMSLNPRRILGLDDGTVVKGEKANFVLINPMKNMVQTHGDIESRSQNSPYLGRKLRGSIEYLFLEGESILMDGKLTK